MKKRLKIINVLLGLVLVGIAVMAVFQISKGMKPPAPEAQPTLSEGVAPKASPRAKGDADYNQAVDGNMFDKSRLPYEPPPAPVVAPPPPAPVVVIPPPNVAVNGIIVAGVNTSAMIEWKSAPYGEKRNRILKVGDVLGDYTVRDISQDEVIFDSGGERFAVGKTRSVGGTAGPSSASAPIRNIPSGSKGAKPTPVVSSPSKPAKPSPKTLINSSKKLKAPEGYEVYMTPMGASFRKIKTANEASSKVKVNPTDLMGHGAGSQ